ncbi:MAG: cytoplasmic protein [Pseudomonadota bacterium]
MKESEDYMGKHKHEFVNHYDEGSIVFGMSREMDEKSLTAFLQKFTDDELMEVLVKRLSDSEVTEVLDLVTGILRKHLAEEEYHRYFLKEDVPEHGMAE